MRQSPESSNMSLAADSMLTDAMARERALDVALSCIVQAPAGSGKTGLLTQRLLRLLLIVEQPEQVLAITFTRKAANEMRARVLQALNDAAAGQQGANEFEASMLRDARGVLERSDALGWALVQLPMRLTIMTVDGLNTRLTRRRPYQARTAGIDILDNAEVTSIYGEAADALFDWLTESGPVADAASSFFEHIDADASRWRRELINMLGRRDQWLPKVLAARACAPSELRRDSEQLLTHLIDTELAVAAAYFDDTTASALRALINHAIDTMPEQERDKHSLVSLEQWPRPVASDLQQWRTLAHFVVTANLSKPAVRKLVTVTQGFPPQDKARKQAMIELLESFAEVDGLAEAVSAIRQLPDATYTDAQWQNIDALLTLLPALAAELTRLMTDAGKLDYPSLASAALMALGNAEADEVPDLALQMDYQLQHILVDEMQDTSVSQYRLLRALTAGWSTEDGRTLFCVGDPMQSIYRFRGAQVSLFLKAWREGIGDVALTPLSLQTNFRSDAGIVDWVNQTFPDVLGEETDIDLERVSYSPSAAAPFAQAGGEVVWHPSIEAPSESTAKLVETVLRIRKREPESSIAILARTRNALEPVLIALADAGVNASGVEMDRLTDLPEVLDAMSLTRALQHPQDEVAWLGVLRAPFVGLSLACIDQLVQWRDAQSPECRPATLWRAAMSAGFADNLDIDAQRRIAHFDNAYQRALTSAATQPLHQRVLALWYRLGGAALLRRDVEITNVHLYFDTLATLERNGQLNRLSELPLLLDARKVDRPGDSSNVTAMTIFKAKGLEFDHVLLPALERTSRNDDQQVLYLELSQETDAMLISAKAPNTTEAVDPLHSLIARRERQRRHNELQRLFYVACTRARRSLHLFANASLLKEGGLAPPKSDSLLSVAWASAAPVFADPALPHSAHKADEGIRLMRPHRRRISTVFRNPEQTLRLTQKQVLQSPGAAVTFDWATSDARHIGTAVHQWFYSVAGVAKPVTALPPKKTMLRNTAGTLAALGVPADQLDVASEQVVTMVLEGIASDAGQWIVSNRHADSAAELALSVANDHGVVERVVIDRIVRADDERLWIIDYKTSRHEGGGLDAFIRNESRRYQDQLAAYRRAVTALYDSEGRDTGEIVTALFFPAYGRLQVVET